MRFRCGRILGHYRIVEKIGEGGMGEVYRAHDERLDRDVAIKVLHEVVARDPDRLARFEREAKAVAKLAHLNILEIWDFGREGGVTYAVTELLDGQNLRQSIPTSGMPWQKVIEIGAAIGDGLAAAHGKGIVHRDLKPENIFVTSDGRVKILDFGLAQVKVPVEGEAETATMTPAGTVVGTVMGTKGYMSPEQLRGEPSDARSDIFALGCVLYEMLSGRTAFLRKSTADTTAAILKEEPPSLSDSATALPSDLERAIRRCLEKSPEARFQSASDLAYNLRSIGTGSAVPVMARPSDETLVIAGSTKPVLRRYALMATGLIIALVASWWALTQLGPDESSQASAFQSMTITPVTSVGTVRNVAISPDGRQLAYIRRAAGVHSIWVRQVATGSEVEVIPPQETSILDVGFTPDGEHVLFVGQANPDEEHLFSIFRVPTLGGEVRRIVFEADGKPTFSPDGQRFAFRRGLPDRGATLMVADADGSGERELAIGQGMGSPVWSPDGRTIAATLRIPEGWRPFSFDVDTGSRHVIANDILFAGFTTRMAWIPGGDGLLIAGSIPGDTASNQIWRLSTDGGTLQRITNDPNNYRDLSLSADGTVLATVLQQSIGHLYVAPADEPNNIRQLTHGSRERVYGVGAVGSSAVFQRNPDGQKWELWACDHDGNNLRRLNTDGSEVVLDGQGVSAVGGEILFTGKGPDNLLHIWSIDETGRPPLQVTANEKSVSGPSLAPDGTWFVYNLQTSVGSGLDAAVWKQPTGGGDPVFFAANAPRAVISPDGRSVAILAVRKDEHGSYPSFLEVIPAEGGGPVISIEAKASIGGRGLRWRPDGKALTYTDGVDGQVWLQPLDGGPPQQLTHFSDGRTVSHAWSPDGKWLYLVREETIRDAVLIRDF